MVCLNGLLGLAVLALVAIRLIHLDCHGPSLRCRMRRSAIAAVHVAMGVGAFLVVLSSLGGQPVPPLSGLLINLGLVSVLVHRSRRA